MRFPAWLPILLGFLTAVGPSTTDMYLPAFPAIEASFGAPPGSAQLTLAAWFAGLAIGQMTQGTLSDRFGRKRPLIVATAIPGLRAGAVRSVAGHIPCALRTGCIGRHGDPTRDGA